jgi:signal peptidase I
MDMSALIEFKKPDLGGVASTGTKLPPFSSRRPWEVQMKRLLKENRGFLVFLLCFGVFRTAVADWNPIPSGSMRPTLLEGDVVFVNRLAYDIKLPLTDIVVARLDEPQRGDIVTFSSPKDGVRLIKRVVAIPGDRVEMRNEVLVVNGEPAQYLQQEEVAEIIDERTATTAIRATEQLLGSSRVVQILPDVVARSSFAPVTVPPDAYFMLGDNRDNSADSRYIGPVPRKLLIGKTQRLLASADITSNWLPRLERFGKTLR